MSDQHKYSELDDEERKQDLDYIQGRWAQLYTVSQEAKKDAAKFIAFVNAGGAATTLAFISALINKGSEIAPLNYAVASFVLGIVLCGVAHGVSILRIDGLFDKWRQNVAEFHSDKITFEAMLRDDSTRSEEANAATLSVWGAWAAFVVGCVIGTCRLF